MTSFKTKNPIHNTPSQHTQGIQYEQGWGWGWGSEIQIKSDKQKEEDMKRVKNMVTQQQQQHTYVHDGI